ncbi:MAG: COX15/CtaA family protein [Ferruginibacter sp.]
MRFLKKWVLATFILCFLVILAGGVVRTTQSGMGCPDWPRCFGRWIPPINASQLPPDFEKYLKVQDIDHSFNVYHTWIEYFNRLLGVLLGIFAVIQTIVLYAKKRAHPNAFRLSIAFLSFVILTGLLGALVVKYNLTHSSVSIHLFFALVLTQIQLALYMNVNGKLFRKTTGTKIRRVLLFLMIILLVQSIFGTIVRMYIDDISKALQYDQREAWLARLPVAFLIHRTFSWFVLAAVLYGAWYCRKVPAVRIPFQRLVTIIILSMTSGIILYYLDMPAVAQPLHLLLAILAITQTTHALLSTKNTTDLVKRLIK